MQLLEEQLVADWLAQFEPVDRDIAVVLLNALNVVDSDVQDAALKNLILSKYGSSNARVALFAAREPDGEDDNWLPYFQHGQPRLLPEDADVGSEGRIARVIRDIARRSGKFLAHPSYEKLQAARPRVLIAVDDFAGSGERDMKFVHWLYSDPRIKSLHSFGRVSFHVAACVATHAAAERLRKHRLIEQFLFATYARTFKTVGWDPYLQAQVRALAIKYGERTRRPYMALGYRKTESLSLLSTSCPNNVPAILWAEGRTWRPLFPHAQVPESVRLCLLAGERLSLGERLRENGRAYVQQALESTPLVVFGQKVLALLAASTKFRMPRERFEQLSLILGLPISEVQVLYEHAKEYHFLDARGRITEHGRFEIRRLAERAKNLSSDAPKVLDFYYPKSFRDQA